MPSAMAASAMRRAISRRIAELSGTSAASASQASIESVVLPA
jgi:hypothetical protein